MTKLITLIDVLVILSIGLVSGLGTLLLAIFGNWPIKAALIISFIECSTITGWILNLFLKSINKK